VDITNVSAAHLEFAKLGNNGARESLFEPWLMQMVMQ
jgi:hypothetical protein